MFNILLCKIGREASDSYAITTSPTFGILRIPNIIKSSFQNGIVESDDMDVEVDAKAPLLNSYYGHEGHNLEYKISSSQPLSTPHGCTFSQTIFNGKPPTLILYHVVKSSHKNQLTSSNST